MLPFDIIVYMILFIQAVVAMHPAIAERIVHTKLIMVLIVSLFNFIVLSIEVGAKVQLPSEMKVGLNTD